MTYQEALDYIHSTCWKGSRPGLERTRELMERLGDPQDSLRFIHVAGTNGKGSTSAMLASVLRAAGYRVGLYTSPFILRFNERMQIDGCDIPDEELAAVTAQVKPHADAMADSPTEFELITAIAFLYFAQHNCDVVVLEVGMGGRLDSTNVIKGDTVAAAVITGIAMDHTAYLGDTPTAIAAEKAGIIKPGVPVIFGGNHPAICPAPAGQIPCSEEPDPVAAACAATIAEKAAATGSRYVEADYRRLGRVYTQLGGVDLNFAAGDGTAPWGDLRDLHIPLSGLYQPFNAATVLTTLEILAGRGFPVTPEDIRRGLATVRWQGRFEILCRDPLFIADGGHNPEGIDAAVAGIRQYLEGKKVYLVSGVMADKDYTPMIQGMGGVTARAFCVRPDNPRSLDPHAYARAFREQGIPAEGYDTVAAGVEAALDAARADGTPVLSLGSLYMYGEVHRAVAQAVKPSAADRS